MGTEVGLRLVGLFVLRRLGWGVGGESVAAEAVDPPALA